MYEVKGRSASDFHELAALGLPLAIEDGRMSKAYVRVSACVDKRMNGDDADVGCVGCWCRYLVKFDVCSIPQCFVVAKDKSVLWYGDITDKSVEVRTTRVCHLCLATASSTHPLPSRVLLSGKWCPSNCSGTPSQRRTLRSTSQTRLRVSDDTKRREWRRRHTYRAIGMLATVQKELELLALLLATVACSV